MTRICRTCVLPEAPGITLDDTDRCSLCTEHERSRVERAGTRPLETDFIKLLNKFAGKGTYDCLVMCSGGKDSTAALYHVVRRYGLRALAFTFDQGFETTEALENVRKAVSILDVDHLLFRSTHMKAMFRQVLSSGSQAVLCHLCSIWYMGVAYDTAARYKIPIIIAGWTRGQTGDEAAPELEAMSCATREFMEQELTELPQYKDLSCSMDEVTRRARRRHKSVVLSPHWFLPEGPEEYTATIRRELDWRAPAHSYPKGSTNCALNFLSVHRSMKHYGFTHYHVEASKLIREGLLTREEALASLEIDFDPGLLRDLAARLDYHGEV